MLVGIGCYVYLYIEEDMSLFVLALSTLIFLNSLICPYTNSQLIKIYPDIINKDLPRPRQIVIFSVWMMFNVVCIGFVIYFSIDLFYENDLLLMFIGLYTDLYLPLIVIMTIIQNLIFYGCATQKFLDYWTEQRL